MGQFSWLDCVTGEQILDDIVKDVYVLVPSAFGGGHIKESCYDGYGNFGGNDIYELVAKWNKNDIPEVINLIEAKAWKGSVTNKDIINMWNYYNNKPFENDEEYPIEFSNRIVGIILAGWDESNRQLKYPIKITYDENAVYEDWEYSPTDPHQGWPLKDDDALMDEYYNKALWNILRKHFGHKIEIAMYGDPDNPANICIEDLDTNEVILDAGIYTICARED